MRNKYAKFEYEYFYHVFNRTNNKEILFRSNENKRYFLELIEKRLYGYVRIYAYALLGNHFHLAISVRDATEIKAYITDIAKEDRTKTEIQFLETEPDEINIHDFISTQFSRVFNSYAQAFNKRYERKGHLFHSPFKRSLIKKESNFSHLIYYIHHNSRKHGLVNNFMSDQWHSYHEILEDTGFLIERDFIFDWFGGVEEFVKYHQGKYLQKDFWAVWIE